MWLIDDEDKRFLTNKDEVGHVATLLKEAQENQDLTLIIGNPYVSGYLSPQLKTKP